MVRYFSSGCFDISSVVFNVLILIGKELCRSFRAVFPGLASCLYSVRT